MTDLIRTAKDVISKVVYSEKCEDNAETYTVLGKIGESGKAPPILVQMKSARDASFSLKKYQASQNSCWSQSSVHHSRSQ